MSKKRKNISIDDNLAKIVEERDEFNLSGFVNRCLEEHFSATSATNPQEAVLRAELDEIESELSELNSKKEQMRERRNQIEEKLDNVEGQEPEMIAQARDNLRGTPRDADNPAVQNWASKLGITSEQLVGELEQ